MSLNLKSIVIVYHGNCPDGFTAAWAAWKKFKSRADYFAVKHRTPPPKGLSGKEVYFLDYCYDLETTRKLIVDNRKVVVLDHHKTARENLKSLNPSDGASVVLDDSHSGAYLAWKHFHSRKPVPQLVLYVEDGDLWYTKLPRPRGSREISAFMSAHEFSFRNWNKLHKLLENKNTRKECLLKGRLIQQYEKKIVNDIANSARAVKFSGKKILAANCPILRSEIGHELVQKRPPFSIVWREKGGEVIVSLRSNGKFDVAKLAEKYGGGGHKSAAGFTIKKGGGVPWRVD